MKVIGPAAILTALVTLSMAIAGDDGTVITPNELKLVAQAGDKYFYADKTYRTWAQAKSYCESMGMQLASIQSEEEATALKNAYDQNEFVYYHWIAARDTRDLGQFSWDGSVNWPNATILPFKNTLGESALTCLSYYSAPSNDSRTGYYPRECTRIDIMKTLCQSTTPDPPELQTLVEVGDKIFYVDKDPSRKRSWYESQTFCRQMGMQLPSISSEEEFVALKNAYNGNSFIGAFWTSGRDSNTLNQYKWEYDADVNHPRYLNYYDAAIGEGYNTCLYYYSAVREDERYLANAACIQKYSTMCANTSN